jgi:hypothetical protein
MAATARNRARGKVGKRGRRGQRGSSPQDGAPTAMERRGSGCDVTKARWQWQQRLGLRQREAAAAGLMGSRARGGIL